jgi:hypothetical protein
MLILGYRRTDGQNENKEQLSQQTIMIKQTDKIETYVCRQGLHIIYVDPLLGNDREISSCTTAW